MYDSNNHPGFLDRVCLPQNRPIFIRHVMYVDNPNLDYCQHNTIGHRRSLGTTLYLAFLPCILGNICPVKK